MSEKQFKVELESVFQKYMAKMPKSESSFRSAIARITWLKESVENVNTDVAPLINLHAGDDEELRTKLKELVVLRTKKMTSQFQKG